ncbi:hypothetical protein E2P81_ATG10786 [Venturia nashicola]|nr:hypothetical protein E2P81_ATG10786 [Venturia nashicola]
MPRRFASFILTHGGFPVCQNSNALHFGQDGLIETICHLEKKTYHATRVVEQFSESEDLTVLGPSRLAQSAGRNDSSGLPHLTPNRYKSSLNLPASSPPYILTASRQHHSAFYTVSQRPSLAPHNNQVACRNRFTSRLESLIHAGKDKAGEDKAGEDKAGEERKGRFDVDVDTSYRHSPGMTT